MTNEQEKEIIAEFYDALGIEYGVGIFRRRGGGYMDLNTTPDLVEKTGLVEMLHRGVQTELNVMHLDRMKERDDAAQRSRPDGAAVPSQE